MPTSKPHKASALALAFGLALGCNRQPVAPASREVASTRASAAAAKHAPTRSDVLEKAGSSIADVAAKVTPSVVNVFSERVATRSEMPRFFQDPFFDFFGGGRAAPELPERQEQGLGSGVIIASDGVIVTNNHVVERADKIRIALKDGRELDAKLVGADPKSDLAVLRVEAKDLPALPAANSSQLRVGEVVLAIGNPFGVGQTVTMGIISAVGRANLGITDYEDFIQTDAAINPGNSGGALVNMDGQLVGINTAIASRSGGYQGVGFAIPATMVMQIKDAILRDGKVVRGWMGVAIQSVDEDLARSLDLKQRGGVLVSDVTPGSPAANAGLKRGDVIVSIDGTATNEAAVLRNLVAAAGKGRKVKVELQRGGKPQTVEITLGEQPAEATAAPAAPGGGVTQDSGAFDGAGVMPLDPSSRRQLRVPAGTEGVLVAQVKPGSPAAALGLQPGDVILEVNRKPTPNLGAFQAAAENDADRVLVLVLRQGTTLFLARRR
jgi:serine protease Do